MNITIYLKFQFDTKNHFIDKFHEMMNHWRKFKCNHKQIAIEY